MPAITVRHARIDTLNRLVQRGFINDATMHLLGGTLTVTDNTTVADCDAVEASFPGYVPAVLAGWTMSTDVSAPNSTSFAFASFPVLPGGTNYNVFGYYLTDRTGILFYGVEVFASGAITLTPGVPYEPNLEYDLFSAY